MHSVEDATMHGFQPISGIGKRTPYNDAHRVFQVGAGHLVPQIRWYDPILRGILGEGHNAKSSNTQANSRRGKSFEGIPASTVASFRCDHLYLIILSLIDHFSRPMPLSGWR
jgi:hypothetical protein